jgi:hypothetical protein
MRCGLLLNWAAGRRYLGLEMLHRRRPTLITTHTPDDNQIAADR